MTAVITRPDVESVKSAPNQNPLVDLANEPLQEKQRLLGSILRGAILFTFAAAALALLTFALNPVVFVTLVLIAFALSPVILSGLAIALIADMQRAGTTNSGGQACSCHRDRLESPFAKR